MRFPAARMFSAEINSISKFEEEKYTDRTAQIAISPLGRKAGRIFHVGTIVEVREVGENVILARVVDKYGAYTVISNAVYQPQIYATLKDINIPAFVAVVGKIRKKDGFSKPFVRPEYLTIVGKEEAQLWEKETTAITEKLIKETEKNLENNTTSYSKEDVEKLLNVYKGKEKKDSEDQKKPEEDDIQIPDEYTSEGEEFENPDPKDYTFEIDTEIIGLKDFKD
ncbi:MAG: hypothetical protein QW540_09005 [Archaeoglobaceae archaeon]